MARVADSELRELVETRDDERVTPFIEDANLLVNETLAVPFPNVLSPERLKLIEKNLAAHFWVIAKEKGGFTMEKMGDSQNMYVQYKGTGLSATRFGQQVLVLDTTGQLDKVLSYVKKAQLRLV